MKEVGVGINFSHDIRRKRKVIQVSLIGGTSAYMLGRRNSQQKS